MAARHILLLDANGLTAYQWLPDGPAEQERFAAGEAGQAAFADYLRRRRGGLFYLLADVAEEAFQIEDMPYVQGGDRKELIGRKLAQLFYGAPLSMAVSLGRAKEGRRDEKFLFAGLTGQAQFEPWLQAMRDAQAQLAGLYSLPQVIAEMIAKLGKAADRVLVITVGGAGLRQTFFDNGQLRFSRLAPMATGQIGEVAAACASESNKIYQYLAGQRLIARDAPLRTLVLAHPGQFQAFAERCPDTPERQVELLDLAALAGGHGLKRPPQDSNAERFFIHLLLRRQPRLQFAPEAERRFYRLWQARHAVRATAAAVIAGGLVFASIQAFNLNNLATTNESLKADIGLTQRRYDAMLQGLPKVPVGMDELRALTDREKQLARRSVGPEPLLHHISGALGKSPRVDLTRLHWRLANSADEDSAPGSRGAAAPRPGGTAANSGGGSIGDYAIVDLQAQLPAAMASDHRSQLETVNAFVAALSAAGVQVRVVSLPFETESGKSIRSGEAATEAEPPRFVLRLARKL